MKLRKILEKARNNPANVRFSDMFRLVEGFGFILDRVDGSSHIFVRSGIVELVNLQRIGGKAKAYQVRQFLKLLDQYNLKLEERDE